MKLMMIGVSFLLAGMATAQVETEVTVDLQMKPTFLDMEGYTSLGMSYAPSMATLSKDKPAGVTKEPKYAAEPLYTEITVGNGPKAKHVVVVDGGKIYVDLNRNGDLTDDGDGAWPPSKVDDQFGTFVFRGSWGTAEKETATEGFGMNLFLPKGMTKMTYFSAGVRTGRVKFTEDMTRITLIPNNNMGVFADANSKPTARLLIGNDSFDLSKPFIYDGVTFEAKVTPDGSKLTLRRMLH